MRVEYIEVPGQSGTLRGKVTLPDSPAKQALVCLHGSPNGDFRGNEAVFDQLADRIPSQGAVILQFSMTGSPPSDGNAKDASIASQSADFNTMYAYTQDRFSLPIHVVGESAGATIAAMNWKLDAASYILLWPAFDLRRTDLEPYVTQFWIEIADQQGFIEDNGVTLGQRLLHELSETDFSKCFDLPKIRTLIMHGQADQEVPYWQSIKAISQAKGPFSFISHPEAGHGFKRKDLRNAVLQAIEDWIRPQ